MPRFKKPKPLAVCDTCGAFTDRHEDINHRCSGSLHGRRCPGNYKSHLGLVWDECQACEATGKVGTEACVECSGWGWRLLG